MRTICKTIVALGVVAMMTGPAMAQQGRGGGRGFGGGGIGMLLSNASVQQELKLDEAQVGKAKAVADKAREKFTASRESLQSLEGEERFKKMQEINKEIDTEAQASIKEFLSEEQVKRLHQIRRQTQGAQAFADEHVQKALKLSDTQKSEIKEVIDSSMQESRSLFQNMQSDPEGTRAKLADLRKETLAKVEGKLSAEQKTSYKEMLGAPFEIKYEGRPGGNR